ncbi:MAG: hypothetical protein DI630_16825 [Gordonia sp. (in: high G+C Gram-positive bacteria)]|nr:MAG: hypothetical protein DI630_16825 [Gordonia sp. (in: high G+C Gram-positive bacteria)]
MVDTPTAPLLATIPGVEIASVGYWNISNADDWHPSAEDLAAAVAAVDGCKAVRRPCLKFGHTGEPGEGDPSIGLVDNLRLDDNGQTLLGDYVGVPAWLAETDDEGRSVIASAYPNLSGEFEHNYVCQLGHTHPFVVHAVALLGVVRPGIGTLASLYDLYANAPQKEEPIMAKATLEASTTVDQVRKAYYNGPGTDWHLWIREMYVDPPELIVQNDADDSIERIPYTVSGEGDVEFGDGQVVKVEYVAARTKAEKPMVAFASRAEGRPGTKPPSAAEAEAKGKEATPMATLNEGLAQRLGITADADDETILSALDAKLATNESEPVEEQLSTEQVAAAAKRHGLTLVDPDKYQELADAAAAGREARDQQLREHRESIVGAAVDKGKITPARRDHFVKLMEADPEGTESLLASLPEQASIPLAEVGHSVEPQDTNNVTENPTYQNWNF